MMRIKDYSAADRSACIEMYNGNSPKFFDPSELKLFESWLDSKDEQRLVYSSNVSEHFYVALSDHELIGCGGFYISAEKEAHLAWGMVANALHRQGKGSALLAYRIDKIKMLYPTCPILLDTTQHSFRFFEKFGFEITKVTPGFYGAALDRYDMVCI